MRAGDEGSQKRIAELCLIGVDQRCSSCILISGALGNYLMQSYPGFFGA